MSCFWYWYWYWSWTYFGISLITYYLLICFVGSLVAKFFIDPFWLLAAIIPIKSYSNAEAEKDIILKENKDKSGIYMWTNIINDKKYIGSSENLKARFLKYFNNNHLLSNTSMPICQALVKHGYSNFSLTILDYCEREKLLIREKHYWDIFNPEYNIAKDPTAPFSGRKHSDKTKKIMSDNKKGSAARESTRARCAPWE